MKYQSSSEASTGSVRAAEPLIVAENTLNMMASSTTPAMSPPSEIGSNHSRFGGFDPDLGEQRDQPVRTRAPPLSGAR